MPLQLTLSCASNQAQSGPTLIHSTGVKDYKIPPEVIRILQENLTNDKLADDENGVLCQDGPQRVLAVLRQNGFTLQKQTTEDQRALWTLVQSGGSSSGGDHVPPPVAPTDDNDADAGNEDQGEGEEGGEEEGGEEEGGEEEEEEEEE